MIDMSSSETSPSHFTPLAYLFPFSLKRRFKPLNPLYFEISADFVIPKKFFIPLGSARNQSSIDEVALIWKTSETPISSKVLAQSQKLWDENRMN